jgi:pantothenate synthetase
MAKSAIGSDVRVSQPDFTGQAVLAIAARIGSTRLIDNVVIEFGTEQHAAGD